MQTKSPEIDQAIQIANAAGNSVHEIYREWSKMKQVVYMSLPLNDWARDEITRQIPSLEHWTVERTPHNAAEEGFTCGKHKVAISFPTR